jgi:four helix bundle protein
VIRLSDERRELMNTKSEVSSGKRTRHYRELLVWQKAMSLARAVYGQTEDLPRNEMYGLQSQIRRAAIAVPSNIAEGHGRLNDGHFRQFLAISRGSLFELETQLELARDLELMDVERVAALMNQCEEIARMINGLLGALHSSKNAFPFANRPADSLTR